MRMPNFHRRPSNRVRIAGATLLLFCGVASPGETVSIRPIADTTLFQTDPNNNLGAVNTLSVGTTAAGLFSRALLRFDLAGSIPASATITSVKLAVSAVKAPTSGGGASVVEIHRMSQAWGEGSRSGGPRGAAASANEATWNARFHLNAFWSAAGAASPADFEVTASARTIVSVLGRYEFASTTRLVADAQGWLTNAAGNFGWILICENENPPESARRYGAREHATDAPLLTVDFVVPVTPPAPRISRAQKVGGEFALQFQGEAGVGYVVEYSDFTGPIQWTVLTNIGAHPVSAEIQVTNSISAHQRIFRIGALDPAP